METFYGTTLRKGIVIASAAVLSGPAAMPSLSPERLYRLADRARRHYGDPFEPDEAILICKSRDPAHLNFAVQGLKIIAVAAAGEIDDAVETTVPTVIGLGEAFLASVEEGALVIVDADRGLVIVDPDAAVVAQYQEPKTKRRPIRLAAVNQPARMASSRRHIEVICRTTTRDSIEEAIAAGADGVIIPSDNDFLGGNAEVQTAGDQAAVILDLFDKTAGLPIYLDIPLETLALQALYEGGAGGHLHLAIRDPEDLQSLLAQAGMVEDSLEQSEIAFSRPHFEAMAPVDPTADAPMEWEGYSGLWLEEPIWDLDLTSAMPRIAHARSAGLPVLACLEGDLWPDFIPTALDLDCDRVVVTADVIGAVKDYIRQL